VPVTGHIFLFLPHRHYLNTIYGTLIQRDYIIVEQLDANIDNYKEI